MCVVHKISRPWLKPEQDIVLCRIFFLLYKHRVVIYQRQFSRSQLQTVYDQGSSYTVSERNKTIPSAACPIPLETNRAGIGGQQPASVQLGSHCPETRCALRFKKAIFTELRLYENNTFLCKDTVHFETCMTWDKPVDILHS